MINRIIDNTYLNGFNDIREKCQFFLLICSLVITFPLSSSLLLNKIISSGYLFLGLYLSGLILLVITIILLIFILREMEVRVPYFDDFISSINVYTPVNVMIAFMKAYSSDLNANIKQREKKRYLLKLIEKFIIAGIILVVGSIVITIIFVDSYGR